MINKITWIIIFDIPGRIIISKNTYFFSNSQELYYVINLTYIPVIKSFVVSLNLIASNKLLLLFKMDSRFRGNDNRLFVILFKNDYKSPFRKGRPLVSPPFFKGGEGGLLNYKRINSLFIKSLLSIERFTHTIQRRTCYIKGIFFINVNLKNENF